MAYNAQILLFVRTPFYIYFIAETKGSMDSLELRDVEKAKIECAKKHFKCISNDEVKMFLSKLK